MSHKSHKAGLKHGLGLVLALLMPLAVLAGNESAKHHAELRSIGAVYTMSNSPEGNAVLVFDRDRVGRLTPAGQYGTGGLGTGTGLGNQSALILDPANRWLFVVNAGSDDISVFAVTETGLTLVDREPAGGERPISMAYSHNLLYVLNAGGTVGTADTITGFSVGADGALSPIAGSTQTLSAADTGPAQITFSTDGDVLVVTEKATNLIDTFTVDSNGVAGPVNSHVSSGTTPFGFAIGKRDQVIVSEAAGGAAEQSSVSSYQLGKDGSLSIISYSIGTTETAACWAVVSSDGRFAYITNAGSGSISGYNVGFDGSLALLDANGRTGLTGKNSGPLDMALSNDGRNLYTLNGGSDTIGVFRVKANGGLSGQYSQIEVPATANGIAAR